MSTHENEKSSLLAPVIGAYEPSDVDAERIFAKIEAALDAPPSSRAPASASTLAAGRSKAFLAAGMSCLAIAVIAGLAVRMTGDVSPALPSVPEAARAAATAAPRASDDVDPKAERPTIQTPIPSVDVDTLPTIAIAPATAHTNKAPASAPSSRRAPSPDADTLAKEARLLADARRASQAGAGERALALLDEHAHTFPNGWLANEREAERILVLCVLGRRAEATRAAAVFLEDRPKGPLTRRVEMSCAGTPEATGNEWGR